MTRKPNCTCKNLGEVSELYIYDEIGPTWTGMISAEIVAAQLEYIGSGPLIVRINSDGGDVTQGMAIYSMLNRRSNVVTSIDGIAASIASVIAMAGDRVEAAENAILMIHEVSAEVEGTAEQLRAAADATDLVNGQIADIYAARTGGTVEDIRAMMAAETWMTAAQAMEKGFVTDVTANKAMAARLDRASKFRSVPEWVNQQVKDSAESAVGHWKKNSAKRRLEMLRVFG